MNEQRPNEVQIQVKISDETLKGTYANMMQVQHNAEEFVLDFMNIVPPNGVISSRIIVSPGHMKRMIAALQENMSRYEQTFGNIKSAAAPSERIGFQTNN